LNTALWIITGLMASVFAVAGSTKLLFPRETLAKAPGGGWVLDFSSRFVKVLGVAEILGALGLILPGLLGIVPVLVPIAAICLGLVMVGAAIVERRRQELAHAVINLIYLALLLSVVLGRLGPEPLG
jgi:uncharacterized membrane protein YphA (DoxX/SURF4 family)